MSHSPAYSSSALDLIEQLLRRQKDSSVQRYVIDGGFHLGAFALAAHQLFPDAHILGFEPDPDTARLGQQNLQDVPNIELIEMALSETQGQAPLFRGLNSGTNSLLPRPRSEGSLPYFPKNATLIPSEKVAITTIDHECSRRDITHLDLLKLDLQGGELAALKGATRLLSQGKIDIVLTEIVFVEKYEKQPLFPDMWQYLAEYGYSFYAAVDLKIGLYHDEAQGPRHHQWNQADAIFLSPRLRTQMDAS